MGQATDLDAVIGRMTADFLARLKLNLLALEGFRIAHAVQTAY